MADHPPDSRSLNFAGDVDEQGRPLPMTVEVLQARTEKWPLSPYTPDGVATLLARSRQMFVDGYYSYENFPNAIQKSVVAAGDLRVVLVPRPPSRLLIVTAAGCRGPNGLPSRRAAPAARRDMPAAGGGSR